SMHLMAARSLQWVGSVTFVPRTCLPSYPIADGRGLLSDFVKPEPPAIFRREGHDEMVLADLVDFGDGIEFALLGRDLPGGHRRIKPRSLVAVIERADEKRCHIIALGQHATMALAARILIEDQRLGFRIDAGGEILIDESAQFRGLQGSHAPFAFEF